MKVQNKTSALIACVILPYMCAVLVSVWYMQTHPGPLPRWIPVAMLCFLVATCLLGGVVISRVARKHLVAETPKGGNGRNTRAIKALQTGLVIYGLILLNGIGLVLLQKIAWNYAVPGLVVDLLLILVFWSSLKRLRMSSTTDPGGTIHQR